MDYSIRLQPAPSGAGRDTVRDLSRQLEPPHLRSFLESWVAREAWPEISAVWLEFDLPPDQVPRLQPSICAQLFEDPRPGFVLDALLPAIHGRDLAPQQRQDALRILEGLPAGARLLYAFSMLSRGEGAVRLEVFGVPSAAVVETVQRAGASRTAARAAAAAGVMGAVDRSHLSFDLLPDGVSSRVGLEGSFRRLPRREPRWGALFDRLQAAGLCSPEERRAVFAWQGYDRVDGPAGQPGFLVRSLSHVKLVCQPDRPLEAKVYLLLEHLEKKPS